MSITTVSTVLWTPGAGGGTSTSIDTTGAKFIVIAVNWYNGGFFGGVADSKGNTWAGLNIAPGVSPSQLFYATNPTVGTGHFFTANGGGFYPAAFAFAFYAIDTTSPFDVQGAGAQGASPRQPGSMTPSVNGELIISAAANSDVGGTSGVSIDSGLTLYTSAFAFGSAVFGAFAWKEQSTAAAINPTWTFTGSSIGCVSAAFKPGAAVSFSRSQAIVI